MVSKNRLVKTFIDLAKIESLSLQEKMCAEFVAGRVKKLGFKVKFDNAHKTIGGNCGNLYINAVNDNTRKPLIFSAHLDTVGPVTGTQPVVTGKVIKSKGQTTLGADDKSGVAVILEMLQCLAEDKKCRYNIEVVLTVAEEIGLKGAKNVQKNLVKAKRAILFDSEGSAGSITVKSPFYNSFRCEIGGRSAHAGVEPEKGINAIAAAAEMIGKVKVGRVDAETTLNIGQIKGGTAKNIVPDNVVMQGEIRSHNEKKLIKITKDLSEIVKKISTQRKAKSSIQFTREFNGFDFRKDDRFLREVTDIMGQLKIKPSLITSGGGSDANIFNEIGIKALNLATGAKNVHTVKESLNIDDLTRAAQLAVRLASSL